jgi:protein phosphatase
VGDSRCYKFSGGTLQPITEDQTWVNEVGRRLGLEEESLKTHPMRHVLTMAIGVSENLRVNTYLVDLPVGTQALLCSDGLHGVVPDSDLQSVFEQPGTLEERCRKLIALARERGGPDNITVVLLKSVEP